MVLVAPATVFCTGKRSWVASFLVILLLVSENSIVRGLATNIPVSRHEASPSHTQLQAARETVPSSSPPSKDVDGAKHVTNPAFLPLQHAIQQVVVDDNEAIRVFHGRGGLFEGCEHITLDWFPPVWLLTSHHIEILTEELDQIQHSLKAGFLTDQHSNLAPVNLVYQHRTVNSTATTRIVSGSVPDAHVVAENGMKFSICLLEGQNQGIFLDMKNGREWVRQNAQGKNVLNLFAYTCGFSVAALMGGATQVVNMDMARGCLKMGQRNHELNNLPNGAARFFAHDIFKSWGKIRKLGTYGIIVIDPPSYQKGSFVAKNDYHKIIRRLPGFLDDDGLAMLCLNAPELDSTWLKEVVAEAAPELVFVERLENPSTFPAKDDERALKILIYRKIPGIIDT